MKEIQIYTDGASRGNPGPGGYGIILKYGGHCKEIAEGYRKTTNNRMELLSVIVALETLKTKDIDVRIFSDSKYVIDAVEKGWVFGWEKKNFSKKKNADLWRRFLKIYKECRVRFVWIKGHAGHLENERCDELAVNAALSSKLLIDEGYETGETENDLFTHP